MVGDKLATAKKTVTKKAPPKTKKTTSQTAPKKTMSQLRLENEELTKKIEFYEESAFCNMCGKHKAKKMFYLSSDTRLKSGVTSVCRKCAYEIACPLDKDGNRMDPTKATVMMALEYLDKPFINSLWDSSYFELHNPSSKTPLTNMWVVYMKNVSMQQYRTMRWKDGDVFKTNVNLGKLDSSLPSTLEAEEERKEKTLNDAIEEDYIKNKRDVIKQVGYDPFEKYVREEDKPFLYASLNSFIDEECKNDGMKMKAIIQIVKTYNQVEKINDIIDAYVTDPTNLISNIGALDKLTANVNKLISSSTTLAKDNGISVNFNNNKSKGANTLAGKIKALTEIGYRDAKVNTFDVGTCEGMKQVAELSEKARHAQIGYDENIAQEIKDIKVELVETLTKERDSALETLRVLLVENMDLKKYLTDKGLMDENGRLISDE